MSRNKKTDGILGALELDKYGMDAMCSDANDIFSVSIKDGEFIHLNFTHSKLEARFLYKSDFFRLPFLGLLPQRTIGAKL